MGEFWGTVFAVLVIGIMAFVKSRSRRRIKSAPTPVAVTKRPRAATPTPAVVKGVVDEFMEYCRQQDHERKILGIVLWFPHTNAGIKNMFLQSLVTTGDYKTPEDLPRELRDKLQNAHNLMAYSRTSEGHQRLLLEWLVAEIDLARKSNKVTERLKCGLDFMRTLMARTAIEDLVMDVVAGLEGIELGPTARPEASTGKRSDFLTQILCYVNNPEPRRPPTRLSCFAMDAVDLAALPPRIKPKRASTPVVVTAPSYPRGSGSSRPR